MATWTLTGRIRPTLRATAATVDFGTMSRYANDVEQRIDLLAAPDIESVNADAGTAWATSVMKTVDGYQVTLRPSGKLVPWRIAGKLRLVPVRTGKELEARNIPLTGEVVEDVQPTTPMIHFGRGAVGANGEEFVGLRSLTGQPFKLIEAKGSASLGVRQEAETRFRVSLPFTKKGDAEEEVSFYVEDAKGRKFRIALPVRYFGY